MIGGGSTRARRLLARPDPHVWGPAPRPRPSYDVNPVRLPARVTKRVTRTEGPVPVKQDFTSRPFLNADHTILGALIAWHRADCSYLSATLSLLRSRHIRALLRGRTLPSTPMSDSPQHDYERLPRTSLEAHAFSELERSVSTSSWLSSLGSRLPGVKTLSERATYTYLVTPRRKKRSILRAIYYTVFAFPYLCAFLVLVAGTFFPSYTNRPAHYVELQQRAANGTEPGRANPYGEKVFIAASLYEDQGQLTSAGWGRSVLELIDLLGPSNVHLSIYEDNPTEAAKQSLDSFRHNVTCTSNHAPHQRAQLTRQATPP